MGHEEKTVGACRYKDGSSVSELVIATNSEQKRERRFADEFGSSVGEK